PQSALGQTLLAPARPDKRTGTRNEAVYAAHRRSSSCLPSAIPSLSTQHSGAEGGGELGRAFPLLEGEALGECAQLALPDAAEGHDHHVRGAQVFVDAVGDDALAAL